MSTDFDVQTTVNGTKGKVVVEAVNKDDNFLSFLNMAGDVLDPNGKPIPLRLVQTGPGTYEADFNATEAGSYVVALSYHGQKTSGILRGGVAVNSQPEFRDLQSNDQKLHEVVDKTGGNLMPPGTPKVPIYSAASNVMVTASPLPVWDTLLPILVGLILLDVAMRRIAWDLASTRRLVPGGIGARAIVHDGESCGKPHDARRVQARERGGGRDEVQEPRKWHGRAPSRRPFPAPNPTPRQNSKPRPASRETSRK